MICAVALALLAFAAAPLVSATEPETPGDTAQTPSAADLAKLKQNEDLAKLKQNPVSGLRQVILQVVANPDFAGSGETQVTYSLQPVFPFSLGKDWKVITYTILPLIQLPGAPGEDTVVGLGDTLINLYVAPKKPGTVIWGAGPAILLPTRTDPALGSNRLGLGPAAIVFYAKDKWSAGLVLQNVWSLGGSGNNEVNVLGAQYIFNYNLAKGWFLYSNATISANWLAEEGDRWTVPVGAGFGRVFNIGKQSVSASLQAFSNVVTPSNGSQWSAIFQFAFLFP